MADEVVVGATKKNLVVTIVDDNDLPVNLTGGSVRLQGKSTDVATTVDLAGTLTDPAQGKVTFASLGSLVTHATLAAASRTSATFALRVKYTDAGALVDYTPEFEIVWKDNPLGV